MSTLLFLASACSGSESDSPSPSSSSSASGTQSSAPSKSSAPGQSSSTGAGTSGGSSGGGVSSGGTSGGSGSADGATTRPADTGSKPVAQDLSPSEFRKRQARTRPFSDFSDMTGYEEVRGKYEPSASYSAVSRGKVVFEEACVLCHTVEGAPIRTTPALSRANIPHLANVGGYRYGASPKSIYRTVAYGTRNVAKGRFVEVLTEDQIWDVVHYVRSLHQR